MGAYFYMGAYTCTREALARRWSGCLYSWGAYFVWVPIIPSLWMFRIGNWRWTLLRRLWLLIRFCQYLFCLALQVPVRIAKGCMVYTRWMHGIDGQACMSKLKSGALGTSGKLNLGTSSRTGVEEAKDHCLVLMAVQPSLLRLSSSASAKRLSRLRTPLAFQPALSLSWSLSDYIPSR